VESQYRYLRAIYGDDTIPKCHLVDSWFVRMGSFDDGRETTNLMN
jgi:hypothetical protein